MHLAIVTHKVDFQDGQGRVNYEIAMAVLKQGDEVTIIADYCSPDIANHPRGHFVPVTSRQLPTLLLHSLWFSFKSARYIRKHRQEFDVLQVNGWVTSVPADIVAVHFVHDGWLHNPFFPYHLWPFKPYFWYQRLTTIIIADLERRTYEQAGLMIAVSASTARELSALGISAKKVQVILNGVNVEEFHPGPAERTSFNLPENVPTALFAGDLRTPRKNLEAVLTALVSLPGVHLAVAGAVEGSDYPLQAKQLGLADRVHFIGKTAHIAGLMRSVDLFVMPSRYETFGMVVVEAMASGLPAILSSRVGAVEIVGDICRVVEDPEDSNGLAAAMGDLLEDPLLCRSMGERGRTRALELQWSNMAADYLTVYDRFVKSKGKVQA